MVFSQTSLKAHTVLKVVKLDHLKSEEKQEITSAGSKTASCIGGYSNNVTTAPQPNTSFTEESLKSEPLYDSEMFHDTDFEFFPELGPLYCAPEKEEVVQTIDSFKKTEENTSIDTPHIPYSPQAWELTDVISPQPQAGFYNNTPQGPLSPVDKLGQCDLFNFSEENIQNQEKFLDISSLNTGFGDSTSKVINNMSSWPTTEPVEWTNPPDTQFNIIYTYDAAPFNTTDDYVDLGLGTVVPGEVEFIDLIPSECEQNLETMQHTFLPKRNEGLSVDVSARAPAWSQDISTPVILNEVMLLEKQKCTETLEQPNPWQAQNSPTDVFTPFKTSPKVDYEPITPKSEPRVESDYEDNTTNTSKRRRHDSEDSDYSPYYPKTTRKYKRRKPSVPTKDLIKAFESQPKARRGRPPKRRESTVSSVCSVDENSSTASTHEYKYRELRDKNNVASQKSRMNRRIKEQQMAELAVELEEDNKKLKVKVRVLEETTKTLKNALMAAILNK